MSLSPTAESTLKLRYSSSIQLRVPLATPLALKLPGYHCWHTEKANANAQASRVKVAPAANSSSLVTRWSSSM